jgi:hypothetical protein
VTHPLFAPEEFVRPNPGIGRREVGTLPFIDVYGGVGLRANITGVICLRGARFGPLLRMSFM